MYSNGDGALAEMGRSAVLIRFLEQTARGRNTLAAEEQAKQFLAKKARQQKKTDLTHHLSILGSDFWLEKGFSQ